MSRKLLLGNVALALILAGLVAADRVLETRREARRAADGAFHAIADAATPPVASVARVELVLPGSTTRWTLERRPEGWRLPQYRDAFALGQQVDGLLKALLESRGTVVGTVSGDGPHFGFLPGRDVEAALYGASGSLLLNASAGRIAPGQRSGECYLRVDGLDRVIHANANPWPFVAWDPATPFPPLLDAKVIPSALGRGFALRITLSAVPPLPIREIVRREIPKERLQPPLDRGPRYEWFGAFAEGEKQLNDAASYAYLGRLTGLTFDELLGSRSGQEAAFAQPSLVVTIEYDGGAKDILRLGAPLDAGRRLVESEATAQAFVISAAKAASLAPDVQALLAPPAAPPPAPALPPGLPPGVFPGGAPGTDPAGRPGPANPPAPSGTPR